MSPLAELQARYDGAIPPAELAAARAADVAHGATLQLPARIGRVTRKAETLVPLLARALLGLQAERGCATLEDLARLGFTEAEVRTHREAAAALAADLCRACGLDPFDGEPA